MHSILQHLFQKNALKEIPVEEIQQCVRQYPYFPVGHLLLTRKLQQGNDTTFTEQLQKTSLYFHNPLWLRYQLQQNEDTAAAIEFPASPIERPMNGSRNGSEHGDEVVPDLIEDVVLHQEAVLEVPEENGSRRTPEEAPGYSPAGNGLSAIAETDTLAEEDAPDAPLMKPEGFFPLQAYHTVDYFASQGIKISQEIQPDDKLGKQLKSFTEWLKTMRRLPEAAEEIAELGGTDTEVEKLAAHSLEENEVITEAMAEVLVKQGKHQRAREVYRKLSLLNPHKNAYFAAKIEALNLH